ncbi:hypothetical protein [Burkholderia plantarii]|nr:hypothetical protein [Burkholderia plantarii]
MKIDPMPIGLSINKNSDECGNDIGLCAVLALLAPAPERGARRTVR